MSNFFVNEIMTALIHDCFSLLCNNKDGPSTNGCSTIFKEIFQIVYSCTLSPKSTFENHEISLFVGGINPIKEYQSCFRRKLTVCLLLDWKSNTLDTPNGVKSR